MELKLDENRFFDPEPSVRRVARELYEAVRDLPLVCPHGHTDPAWFAENQPFPDPAELFIMPDHYVFRMLYSQGIPLERLGIPPRDGSPVETDRRQIWQLFADHFYLFRGTPTSVWLNHAFHEVFGVREALTGESAMRIYDWIAEKLRQPEFLPRALFARFNIEVLTTTDAADSELVHHQAIRDSDWEGHVIPCFRPDGLIKIDRPDWGANLERLSRVSGIDMGSYADYLRALEARRVFFKQLGAVSTDHDAFVPYTEELSPAEAETIFQRALGGKLQQHDAPRFEAHMLMEMARMSVEDGLVMQIHPGSFRNHNRPLFEKFGPDKGCDIPVQTEFTRNLHALLNKYGNDPRFTLIVFTLDESTYSRELAPLAGHYPALRLGPAWWFHDSIEGMRRFRQRVTETAGIYNTAGFNDDTRAFPSIPARHDLARRMDCNFLANLVARHIVTMAEAHEMARDLAYNLVKQAYRLT